MQEFKRILIIRPSALGDVCRTVPALVSLRRAYPDAVIEWLVRDSFQDAVAAHPALTSVVPFARADLGRSMSRARPGPTLRWLRSLRARHDDLVIDLQGLARSAIFAWATRAPRRIGFADARELAWLAYTDRVDASSATHTVDRMLLLIASLGIEITRDMRLYAPSPDHDAVDADERLRDADHVVIAPTSIWPAKRWSADRFLGVAQGLLDAGVSTIAVVGAPGERDQCAPLLDLAARDRRVLDLVGKTGVGRLMAVVERSCLVIANDSAPLHMAVGFDRPIVALFGPTHTRLVGPYRRDADVIQHLQPNDIVDHKNEAAGRTLMSRISVDEVLGAAAARLDAAGQQPARPISAP